jgi:lysophospholipase L1-like esterase
MPPFKPLRDTGRRNIIFFGDSLSFGAYVSPHRIWVTQLSAMIEREFGDGFLVINTSINANTTRLALERMPEAVQRYGCEILCAQFGVNDANFMDHDQGLPRTQPEAFRANMQEIIARGFHVGARTILLPTSHPTLKTKPLPFTDIAPDASRRSYAQVTRQIAAADPRLVLVDIEKVFDEAVAAGRPLENFLMPDQVHLSDAGHELYFQTFAPVIRKLLREPARGRGVS